MTPQEQGMLDGLIGRVQSTQLQGKDPEAEGRIRQALGGNPDALYVLCQTVLVQGYALEQATAQLNATKQQLAQAQQAQAQQAGGGQANHPGFLEKIFGSSHGDSAAPAQAGGGAPAYGGPVYNSPQGMPPQGYAPAPPVYGGYPAAPGYGQPASGFGGGGFLQGALQTAAGVAMGEIAVQSIEGLVHGLGHEAGYGSDRALGGFGDGGGRDFGDTGSGDSYGDRLQRADDLSPGLSPDIDDRRDERSFAGSDAGDNESAFVDDGNGNGGDDSQYDGGDSGDDFNGGDDSGGSY